MPYQNNSMGEIDNLIQGLTAIREKQREKYENDLLSQLMQAEDIGGIRKVLSATPNKQPSPILGQQWLGNMLNSVNPGGTYTGESPLRSDIAKRLLLEKIQQSDPAYQLGIEATRTNISGDKQRQSQSAGLYPGELAGQQLGLESTQANIKGAEQRQRQSDVLFPGEMTGQQLENQYKQAQINKANMPKTPTPNWKPLYGDDGKISAHQNLNTGEIRPVPEGYVGNAPVPENRAANRLKVDNYLYDMTHSGSGANTVDKQPSAGEWETLRNYAADLGFEVVEDKAPVLDEDEGLFNMWRRSEPLVKERGNYRIVDKKTMPPMWQRPSKRPPPAQSETGTGQSNEPPMPTPAEQTTDKIELRPDLYDDVMAAQKAIEEGKDPVAVLKRLQGVYPADIEVINEIFQPTTSEPANLESNMPIETGRRGVVLPVDASRSGGEATVGGRSGEVLPFDAVRGGTEATVGNKWSNSGGGVKGTKYPGYGPAGEVGGIIGRIPKGREVGSIIGTGDPLVDDLLRTREGQEIMHQYGGFDAMKSWEKEEYLRQEGRRRLLQMLGVK